MESLEYIAERLDTSVSALLEDGSEVTTNNIYNEIKQILKVPNISHQKKLMHSFHLLLMKYSITEKVRLYFSIMHLRKRSLKMLIAL